MTSNILDLDTFINSNADWENLLSKPPYCLKIKRDGHYVLFKYDQLNSDLSLRIVQEARGSIFYEHYNGTLNLICLPFLKFFNYGEKNAVNIEWGTAYVTEKIDGSLMQLWYHEGWHLSTSGTIDAFKAKVGDTDESFGNVFERAIGTDIQDFANKLNLLHSSIYLFELVSPETRVVIPYAETAVYVLTARDMLTLQEYDPSNWFLKSKWPRNPLRFPQKYHLFPVSPDVCFEIVNQMNRDHEGVVVCDVNYNRVKVKSPEYLAAAHLANNGIITTRRIIMMWRNGQLDDFVAYLPQYREKVEAVIQQVFAYEAKLNAEWKSAPQIKSDKEMFQYARRCTNADFIMKRHKGHVANATEYINKCDNAQLLRMIFRK